MSVSLVAMARSGETFVVRDPWGQLWLIAPAAAGGTTTASDELVQRAIGLHGFRRVERSFDSWEELDACRQELAAEVTPSVVVDVDHLDADDVREMLAVAFEWQSEGQLDRVRRLVASLLRLPVVRQDTALNEEVVALLLEAAPRPIPAMAESSIDGVRRRALEQMEMAAAA